MTETEKAYFAGIFDGEGCVGYYTRYTKGIPYHSASLHICMTERHAIDWVVQAVGYGRVSFSEKSGNRKSVWSWQLCNKPRILELLTVIRPYLTVKAEQVDTLFALWKAEEAFPVRILSPELIALRQATADKMRALKTSAEGVETRQAESSIH